MLGLRFTFSDLVLSLLFTGVHKQLNVFPDEIFLFEMNLSGGLHFQPVLVCWWCSVQ